jgi:hypothetical protein
MSTPPNWAIASCIMRFDLGRMRHEFAEPRIGDANA